MRRSTRLTGALLTVLLTASCAGDTSTPTPPAGELQSVVVSVQTTGDDRDDVYTVVMGSRSAAMGSSGSVVFQDVAPGTYTVTLTDVADNCEAAGGNTRAVTVSSSSGGEVQFEVACTTDFGDGLQTVACPSLSLAVSAGVPGERIAVGHLPSSFEPPLFARVLLPDDSDGGYTFLGTDEEGSLGVVVPIHPSLQPDGGPVRIRVADGTLACPPVELRIDPLQSSPQELSNIVDLLQQIIDTQALTLGTTSDDLVSTPLEELPTYLVPLAAVQGVIDHPDNENSLAAIAAGSSPSTSEARLDLLEPLLAGTGLREALEASLNSMALPDARGRAQPSDLQCSRLGIGNNPAMLDACMDRQASAAFRVAGATGEVLKKLGDVVGVLGFVPALGTVTAVGGATIWAVANADARTAALLPSQLVDMDLNAGPTSFAEDSELEGSWSASVAAQNVGWDMGKEFFEALLQAAGALGAFDKTQLSGDALSSVLAGAASGPISEQLIGQGTLEEFRIPPETFGPVTISHPDWSEAEIHGDAFKLDEGDHTVYEPWIEGQATLSVRTEDGEFGGNQIAEQEELVVRQLDLDILPEERVVRPGEEVTFDVTVQDAEKPDAVEVDQPLSQGSAERAYLGENLHRIWYRAPAQPDLEEEVLLTARYTGTSGARENASEERTATAVIRFASLEISASKTSCIGLGDVVSLEAEVEGVEDPAVTWDAAGPASLEPTGDLAADLTPTGEGTVTVTAEVSGVPGLEDEIELSIGECVCSWSLSIGGATLEAEPGDEVHFTDWPPSAGGDHELVSVHVLDNARGVETVVYPTDGTTVSDPSELPSGPGTFPGVGGGGVGADFFYGSDGNVGIFQLDEYEKTKTVVGSMEGSVVRLGDPDEVPIPFSVTFSVTAEAVLGARYRCTVPEGGE